MVHCRREETRDTSWTRAGQELESLGHDFHLEGFLALPYGLGALDIDVYGTL